MCTLYNDIKWNALRKCSCTYEILIEIYYRNGYRFWIDFNFFSLKIFQKHKITCLDINQFWHCSFQVISKNIHLLKYLLSYVAVCHVPFGYFSLRDYYEWSLIWIHSCMVVHLLARFSSTSTVFSLVRIHFWRSFWFGTFVPKNLSKWI